MGARIQATYTKVEKKRYKEKCLKSVYRFFAQHFSFIKWAYIQSLLSLPATLERILISSFILFSSLVLDCVRSRTEAEAALPSLNRWHDYISIKVEEKNKQKKRKSNEHAMFSWLADDIVGDHAKMSVNDVYIIWRRRWWWWNAQRLDELLTILIQNLWERVEKEPREKRIL